MRKNQVQPAEDYMKIEKGILDDLSSIMGLIKSVIQDMERKNIFQWNENYPTTEVFENDILNNSLYLIRHEDGILGIIVFDENQSPEYSQIDWASKDERVLVIHRLAINPKFQGHGYARKLMDYAEEYARNKGYTAIRLDAYTGNPRTLSFYEKRDYKKTGVFYFPWMELPLNCYEKVL